MNVLDYLFRQNMGHEREIIIRFKLHQIHLSKQNFDSLKHMVITISHAFLLMFKMVLENVRQMHLTATNIHAVLQAKTFFG